MILKRPLCYLLAFLIAFCCTLAMPSFANVPAANSPVAPVTVSSSAQPLEQQGKALYDAERFAEAVPVLQQAAQHYQQQDDLLREAIALSNLALTYEKLGIWTDTADGNQVNPSSEWTNANATIKSSLALLNDPTLSKTTAYTTIKAQILDVLGRLQFTQGQVESALETWQQAAQLYEQLGDTEGQIRNRIDQSRALQALGLYQQARDLLNTAKQTLQAQALSLTRVAALRSLGDVLRATGDLENSHQTLQESLELAQQLPATQQSEILALIQLSLGNTARAQRQSVAALNYYEAATQGGTTTTRLQAQLNCLSLLIEEKQRLLQASEQPATERQSATLRSEIAQIPQRINQIYPQLNNLLPSQTTVYIRTNFTHSLAKLVKENDQDIIGGINIEQFFTTTQQQAEQLNDSRTLSYALGMRGEFYEVSHRWAEAETATLQALQFSQGLVNVPEQGFFTAPDVRYLWQWQLGRIFKAQADRSGDSEQYRKATVAYGEAIKILQSLRLDLVAASQDQQFNFRESIEPAYRDYIQLLLRSAPNIPLPQQLAMSDRQTQPALATARQSLQDLRVAELQNFLRAACLNVPIVDLDKAVEETNNPQREGARAALIYPIILPDRLSVVLKLPQYGLPLLHYSTEVEQDTVKMTLKKLRGQLTQPIAFEFTEAAHLYNWLIRPAIEVLESNNIDTLVFVLDGALQSVPMAALYNADAKQYLIEKYSIALAPSLKTPDPQTLSHQRLRILLAGLSQFDAIGSESFSNLDSAAAQIETIKLESEEAGYGVETLLNQDFTAQKLEDKLHNSLFQVVHLITHGKFSSDPEETFILAAAQIKIKLAELSQILKTRDQNRPEPIELLVLSACETAKGDSRAALGMAGVAVQAGARSTLASLWSIYDQATQPFMPEFYRQLRNNKFTKAEALRQAQLTLLNHPNYSHPINWAPFILLGNWL